MARRFRRWPGLATTLIALFLLAAALRAWWTGGGDWGASGIISSTAGSRAELLGGQCEIAGALDGSTLLIKQGQHHFRARLLGVALPDGHNPELARAELSRIAPPGDGWIELDKRRAAADGSWLAYVYVGESLVNAELLAAGSAQYDVYPGDSFTIGRQLKQAQDEARRNKRGLWEAYDRP